MSHLCTPRGHALNSAIKYSLLRNKPDLRLGTNFVLSEFASKDGADEVLVHPALIIFLEDLRRELGGVPLTINSGYRSRLHNARVGGASDSRHLYGLAADVSSRHKTPAQIYEAAKKLNPGGLGKYHSFTHVDVEGINRRWNGP